MPYSRREFLSLSGAVGVDALAPSFARDAEMNRREPVKYEKGLEQPAYLLLPLFGRFNGNPLPTSGRWHFDQSERMPARFRRERVQDHPRIPVPGRGVSAW